MIFGDYFQIFSIWLPLLGSCSASLYPSLNLLNHMKTCLWDKKFICICICKHFMCICSCFSKFETLMFACCSMTAQKNAACLLLRWTDWTRTFFSLIPGSHDIYSNRHWLPLVYVSKHICKMASVLALYFFTIYAFSSSTVSLLEKINCYK